MSCQVTENNRVRSCRNFAYFCFAGAPSISAAHADEMGGISPSPHCKQFHVKRAHWTYERFYVHIAARRIAHVQNIQCCVFTNKFAERCHSELAWTPERSPPRRTESKPKARCGGNLRFGLLVSCQFISETLHRIDIFRAQNRNKPKPPMVHTKTHPLPPTLGNNPIRSRNSKQTTYNQRVAILTSLSNSKQGLRFFACFWQFFVNFGPNLARNKGLST